MLQGHAVAPGTQAVSCHSQRAVIICQSSVLYHRHVPQKGIRLPLCLEGSTFQHMHIKYTLYKYMDGVY